MCAILVFTCVSNQRSGLWGPSLADCAACNGTTQCTTGQGGPHGLGCGYLAFGQFQCAPAYAPAQAPQFADVARCAPRARAPQAHLRRRHHVVDRRLGHSGARLHRTQPAADDGTHPDSAAWLRCAALPQPAASRAPRYPGALTLRVALRRSS